MIFVEVTTDVFYPKHQRTVLERLENFIEKMSEELIIECDSSQHFYVG
jgi:hypothetical protein